MYDNDTLQDAMRPKEGGRVVNVPITFSKKSEGSVNKKTLIWSLIVGTTLFVIFIYGLLTGQKPWYFKIPLSLIAIYAYTFLLRFFVFREGRLSDAYEEMSEKDYKLSTNAFWSIYDISTKPPFTVHYANGLKGIFVQFDKNVIVGKEENMEYIHFEKLGNMYNVAHTLNMDMVNIDYMDIVGNDSRMEPVFAQATNSDNKQLKKLLLSMYGHLEYEMSLDYTSYDVYLFTGRMSEEALWYNVREVIQYGLKANYKSYKLFPPNELRKMTQTIMNLENFSLLQAEKEVITSTLNRTITPIKLIKGDGTEQIFNKTKEQRRKDEEDAKLRIEAERRAKKEEKNKSKNVSKQDAKKSKKAKEEELVDLFEETTILDKQFASTEPKQEKVKSKGKKEETKPNQDKEDEMEDIF